MEFGLYAWRPDLSVDRKLKEGAKMLVGGLRARGGGAAASGGGACARAWLARRPGLRVDRKLKGGAMMLVGGAWQRKGAIADRSAAAFRAFALALVHVADARADDAPPLPPSL